MAIIFLEDVIVTGSDTATLSETGLTLSRSNSYIQSNADNEDTLNIGQSSVRWGNVKVDGATFKVLNGGNERFGIDSSGDATFAGHIIPTSDGTQDIGTTNSLDFRSLYIRDIDIYNQRFRMSSSGTIAVLEDHSSVGDGFKFNHLGTEILRLGNGSSTTATFAGDVTISKSTPVLTFNNLAGGGLDPSLTATGTDFTISTSSITPLTLALDTGNATFAGSLSASISADSDSTYTGIVVSESGTLKYRTKAEIRSDIGAGTGSGDVTASGGADNYVAVFSSATQIEGESNFTWNGTTLAVTGGGSYSGALLCDNLNLGNNTDTTLSRTGAGEVSIENQRIFADNYHPNADVWTTARTITIGNTGKSVNGSANVTWTLSEIGVDGVYLPLAGGTMTGTTSHGDNVKSRFGTGNDLTIYATGTTSILDIPAGDFHIGDYETFSTGSFSFARVSGETGIYQPEEGLFALRVNGSTNHIFIGSDGTDVVEIDHESMTVTGDIKLESNSEIELDGNGGLLLNASADVTGTEGNGIIIKFHSTGTTAGSIYYKSNLAAAWSLADADNDTATRMLAVALGSNSGTSGMLLQGVFRKASHGFSAGAPLYLSTTAGAFTTSVPTGSNDYARLVGYVLDANLIYFNPDNTWVQNN